MRAALRIRCEIWPHPVEIAENAIPLDRDEHHRAYDRDAVERFWRILALTHDVFTKFRARFIGKCSPVHFFWGSFDLAVKRFSGRIAPPKPDTDAITREAYSHEVSSVGWWRGDNRLRQASFYCYASPEPPGFRTAPVKPAATYYTSPSAGSICTTTTSARPPIPNSAARLLPDHLRSRRQPRRMGPRRARAIDSLAVSGVAEALRVRCSKAEHAC